MQRSCRVDAALMSATATTPDNRPMWTLNVVGPGRVGRSLSRLWLDAGVAQLQAVLARQPGHAQAAIEALCAGTACTALAQMPRADVWLLAVPDTQIAIVAAQLAELSQTRGWAPAQAWHCSGFLTSAEMTPLQALGWDVASAHPALSFADPDRACAQFPGTVCALEGTAAALQRAQVAFEQIGGRCFELQAAQKPLYHGAAVFASNFLPVLQAVATELWQGTGVPPAWVPGLAQGFLTQVSSNVQALGPRGALTGPAARGDGAVLAAQGQAMNARDAALGEAYASLSELAGRLARSGQVLGEPPGS